MCKWLTERDGIKWCTHPDNSLDRKSWVAALCVLCEVKKEER